MTIEVVILIIAVFIIAIWVLFKFKSIQHRFLLFFLIALILFSFFSFSLAFNNKDLSITNISDVGRIGKIYFSWMGNAFNNMKTITNQVIKMNWEGNKTT